MIRLLGHPLLPIYRQQVVSLSQSFCVSLIGLTDRSTGGREGVGGEPNHNEYNDGEKAWPSIVRSILTTATNLSMRISKIIKYAAFYLKMIITNVRVLLILLWNFYTKIEVRTTQNKERFKLVLKSRKNIFYWTGNLINLFKKNKMFSLIYFDVLFKLIYCSSS